MGSVIEYLSQRLVPLAYAFLLYVSMYLLPLLTFISAFIFRLPRDDGSVEKNGEEIDFLETERGLSPECIAEKDVAEFIGFDSDAGEEKEEVFLKFKFPTFDEFSRIHERTDNSSNSEVFSFPSSSKYEFTSGEKFVRAFIDELETFPVEETNANRKYEVGKLGEDYNEISVCNGEGNSNTEAEDFVEKSAEKFHPVQEPQCFSEKDSIFNGSCSDSIDVDHIPSAINSLVDSHCDDFLSGEYFELESMQESSPSFNENLEPSEDFHGAEEMDPTEEEPNKLTEHNDLHNPDKFDTDFLSEEDFKGAGFLTSGEKTESNNSAMSDSDNKLESLWEHKDLLDQLKTELRKVRESGLPTILEESESPKIMEDLKPWKMDEKLQRGDGIGELHKFYKSYRERMRKFDIVNHQKMYAVG